MAIQLVIHAWLGAFCQQGRDAEGNRYCQRADGGPWYHANTPDGRPVDDDVIVEVVLPSDPPASCRINRPAR